MVTQSMKVSGALVAVVLPQGHTGDMPLALGISFPARQRAASHSRNRDIVLGTELYGSSGIAEAGTTFSKGQAEIV